MTASTSITPPNGPRASGRRRWDRLAGAAFAAFSLYVFAFVGLRADIALNRVNDAWWHVSAADEMMRTGVFAADPFLESSVPFSQFGLLEVLTVGAARMSGFTARQAWSWMLGVSVIAAAWACYLCGWWVSGFGFVGFLAFALWFAVAGELGLHGLGYPFYASVPLMHLLLLTVCRTPVQKRWRPRTCLPIGIALGLLFALHALTGLFAGFCLAAVAAADAVRRLRGKQGLAEMAASGGILVCASVAVAFPWLRLHVSLRPVLSAVNSHRFFGYSIPAVSVAVAVAATALLAGAAWAWRRTRAGAMAGYFAFWTACALVLAWPPVNRLIAEATSDYMAARVLWFVPFAVAVGVAGRLLLQPGRVRALRALLLTAAAAALLFGPLGDRLAVHAYLLRTDDLKTHWCGHLERLEYLELDGKTVLTDPETAYYCRGLLGAYVISLRAGMASPAVDFASRDKSVRASLRAGRPLGLVEGVDAVVVEKKLGLTEGFAGLAPAAIKQRWLVYGWRAVYEDDDVLALVPERE